MPNITVTVDGKKVEVAMGATILDATKAAGARVPTLCHDNKLHPFGACRICLVEVEGTPRKFTPSCTTPATDNMVVRTMTPSLIEARRMVLELLLIKHPLDCPVCDKAGA
jgi:NADH dehydrogenase/NADH:ubiquinone oxidoreductase subunit G